MATWSMRDARVCSLPTLPNFSCFVFGHPVVGFDRVLFVCLLWGCRCWYLGTVPIILKVWGTPINFKFWGTPFMPLYFCRRSAEVFSSTVNLLQFLNELHQNSKFVGSFVSLSTTHTIEHNQTTCLLPSFISYHRLKKGTIGKAK
jgi:hypothetical protein